ncbi:MAG: hypothetical protein WEB63_11080 [Cucumibacter sp.]
MRDVVRSGVLASLREHIEKVENRPLLLRGGERLGMRPGGREFVPWRDAPAGLLHEVWAATGCDAGAGLGFALGLARGLISPGRPVVLWLQGSHQGAETGILYGAGIASFGLDADRVVIGRMKSIGDLLWCAEEALGCTGVAAVIADIAAYPKALDFTASRRLALRAKSAGVSMLIIRYGPSIPASAAFMRWLVAPAPSGARVFDDKASGAPRFAVTLDRSGGGLKGNWLLEWTNDGFGEIDSPESGARKAASGALVPVLGDRLSRTA